MSDKVYTLEEIKAIASPIARRYDIAALYLFGSYARGGLYSDLEEGFQKKLDVLTTQMLSPSFLDGIRREEVLIYAHNQS